MRIAVALLLIAGCDQIYGLTGRGEGDASTDALSPNGDAIVDMACANLAFDPAILAVDGSFAGAIDPALSANKLELYFSKQAADGIRLYRAQRPDPLGPWDPPMIIPLINSTNKNDTDPSITADGLRLFFLSNRDTANGRRLVYEARRNAIGSEWNDVRGITSVTNADVDSLDISADGLSLYVVDPVLAGTPLQQYVRANVEAPFGARTDTGIGIRSPSIDAAEQAVYSETVNGIERWTRTSNVFLSPMLVVADALDPDLSYDGQTLTFVRKSDGVLVYMRARCEPDQ